VSASVIVGGLGVAAFNEEMREVMQVECWRRCCV
jgi:hypothetical protein